MKVIEVIKHKLKYSNTLRDLALFSPAIIKVGLYLETVHMFHKVSSVLTYIHTL